MKTEPTWEDPQWWKAAGPPYRSAYLFSHAVKKSSDEQMKHLPISEKSRFWEREKNAFCSLPGYPQQQPSFLKNKK
jgi:hypothetical protein